MSLDPSVCLYPILILALLLSNSRFLGFPGAQSLSCVWLFVTPMACSHQASLSMEFSKQEYWSRLPLPSPLPRGHSGKKKNLPANGGDARDGGLILVLGRSPGVGNGNPLQYYCWDNSMDRGTWRATVHGITKNWIHACTHTIALRTHKEKWNPPLSSVTDTSELMELFFDEGLGMMVDNMKTPGPPRG